MDRRFCLVDATVFDHHLGREGVDVWSRVDWAVNPIIMADCQLLFLEQVVAPYGVKTLVPAMKAWLSEVADYPRQPPPPPEIVQREREHKDVIDRARKCLQRWQQLCDILLPLVTEERHRLQTILEGLPEESLYQIRGLLTTLRPPAPAEEPRNRATIRLHVVEWLSITVTLDGLYRATQLAAADARLSMVKALMDHVTPTAYWSTLARSASTNPQQENTLMINAGWMAFPLAIPVILLLQEEWQTAIDGTTGTFCDKTVLALRQTTRAYFSTPMQQQIVSDWGTKKLGFWPPHDPDLSVVPETVAPVRNMTALLNHGWAPLRASHAKFLWTAVDDILQRILRDKCNNILFTMDPASGFEQADANAKQTTLKNNKLQRDKLTALLSLTAKATTNMRWDKFCTESLLPEMMRLEQEAAAAAAAAATAATKKKVTAPAPIIAENEDWLESGVAAAAAPTSSSSPTKSKASKREANGKPKTATAMKALDDDKDDDSDLDFDIHALSKKKGSKRDANGKPKAAPAKHVAEPPETEDDDNVDSPTMIASAKKSPAVTTSGNGKKPDSRVKPVAAVADSAPPAEEEKAAPMMAPPPPKRAKKESGVATPDVATNQRERVLALKEAGTRFVEAFIAAMFPM